MTISLGTDHAGFPVKQAVAAHLRAQGHEVLDFGAHDGQPSNYPEFVIPAAEAAAGGQAQFAFVFGGSGNGEAIAANKVRGIRCAVCWAPELATLARRHNNANALSLPGRFLSDAEACSIVDAFLEARFEGGRHQARLAAITAYENRAPEV